MAGLLTYLLAHQRPKFAACSSVAVPVSTAGGEITLRIHVHPGWQSWESVCACCRALIIGPADTPYANGCFIFDIFLPSNYPNVPPQVHFLTTGGKLTFSCAQPCDGKFGHWLQRAGTAEFPHD